MRERNEETVSKYRAGAAARLLRNSVRPRRGASIDWSLRGIAVKADGARTRVKERGAMEDWLGYAIAVCMVLLFMIFVGVLPVRQ